VVACSSSSSNGGTVPPDGGGDGATPPPPPPPGSPSDAGDGGGAGALPSGGSRIAARFREGSDGSRFFVDLYDRKLSVTCDALRAEDGVLRCVPRGPTTLSDRYSDVGCTTRVARSGFLCQTGSYAVDDLIGCGVTSRTVYEIGTTPITTTFFKDAGGTCQPAAAPGPSEAYFATTRRVAPSELVAFTPHDEPLATGLAVHVLAGDDGSRVLLDARELVDVARAAPCHAALGADGKARCLPITDWYVAGFSDLACLTPVAFGRACSLDAGAPEFATEDVNPGPCDPFHPQHVFPVTTLRPTHDWYHGTPGSCSGPVELPDDLVDVGAELPPTGFPALAYEPLGGTKLVADTFHSGTLVLGQSAARDQSLMVPCDFKTAKDGVVRCLPTQPAAGLFFSEMTCTTPLANGDETCGAAKYVSVPDDSASCTPKDTVYALGTRMDAAATPLFWLQPGAGCVPFVGSPGGKYVWPLGAEVPAATFVDAKLVEH
jgi:hypothetical protein